MKDKRDLLARFESELLEGDWGTSTSCHAAQRQRKAGLVIVTHDEEPTEIGEEGECRRYEMDVERARVDLHMSLIPRVSPALVEEI